MAKKQGSGSEWPPEDDVALLGAVQVWGAPAFIAANTRFSRRRSAEEISSRWNALLFDEEIARNAAACMVAHPSFGKRLLWSEEEERSLLEDMDGGQMFRFNRVLQTKRPFFHSSRTGRSLEAHYYRMRRDWTRRAQLLGVSVPWEAAVTRVPEKNTKESDRESAKSPPEVHDGTARPISNGQPQDVAWKGGAISPQKDGEISSLSFEEVEERVLRSKSNEEHSLEKMMNSARAVVGVESQAFVLGCLPPVIPEAMDDSFLKFSRNVLGVFKGEGFCQQMKTRICVLGRATPHTRVDIDLSCFGERYLSRRQLIVRFVTTVSRFQLKNIGRSVVFVNGVGVRRGGRIPLFHNALIEVGRIRIIFEANCLVLGLLNPQASGQSSIGSRM